MVKFHSNNLWLLVTMLLAFLMGCNTAPAATATPTPEPPTITPAPTLTSSATATLITTSTPTFTLTPSATPTNTLTPSLTSTATDTSTPTETLTPSMTPTATETPTITPTPPPPEATVIEQSYCRYGPGSAYMTAYGLYEGDQIMLYGKNRAGDWLWAQSPWYDKKCWINAALVTTAADLESLPFVETDLPLNPSSVNPPTNVQAVRNGSQVTISWADASPQVELSYLVEAKVCQGGEIVEVAYYTTGTLYTLTDESGCEEASSGKVYLRNKLGYSVPVIVAWP